jgi:hypothetical protein
MSTATGVKAMAGRSNVIVSPVSVRYAIRVASEPPTPYRRLRRRERGLDGTRLSIDVADTASQF